MNRTVPARDLRPAFASLATWALSCAGAATLVLAQYLRPSPLGKPYVLDVQHYLGYALLYELFGLSLLCVPFLVLTLAIRTPRWAAWLLGAQIVLLAVSLFLTQWNHELQRFMGAQLSLDELGTYGRVDKTPEVIWQALRDDRGGSWSSLWWASCVPLFVLTASFSRRMTRSLSADRRAHVMLLALPLIGMLAPSVWLLGSSGGNRKAKLRPPAVLLWDSLHSARKSDARFSHVNDAVRRVQADWLAVDGSGRYHFPDAEHPLRHALLSQDPAASEARPNILLLSLETFRARDMASFNPTATATTTPFLDALARDSQSARYLRYVANGIPTVYAFMAMQTGTLPHSQLTAARVFTGTGLDAFPQLARERGYTTLFFTGSDPDWDNQRFWLDRWYDETHYDPSDHERDRPLFRRAAQRIVQAGRSGKPFLAVISSISNHTPFHTPEPALRVSSGDTIIDHLHDTMHYTDDVVRELLTTLRHEPWFEHTIVFITGDHGYDLGDHGEQIGHTNLHHESIWVPLIVYGRDARLPRGAQTRPASHMDLAPTIADLVGFRGPTAFLGHSLLAPVQPGGLQVAMNSENLGIECDAFSAYLPVNGAGKLYAAGDAEQRTNLAAAHRAALEDLRARAHDLSLVTDWAFEHDRFAPQR